VKLSDYLAQFLVQSGVRHAFAIAGGASLHLIDSIALSDDLELVCPQHEQGCAMAADAYSRRTGRLGVAIATSGPGATNMVTGAASAFYDSIPVLLITGQVSSSRMKGNTGVRQIGFQETDTVEIFTPVTKYAARLAAPGEIRYQLEKCLHLAQSGRPGPVLLDIPDDLQRAEIDPDALPCFSPEPAASATEHLAHAVKRTLAYLKEAERPVLIVGAGVRLAGAEQELSRFIEQTGIPFAPTWAAADLYPSDHPGYIGTFGTHGTRHANFAVQNADLILSVGSRLDTKATGSPVSSFARGARRIMVDIDPAELAKFAHFGLTLDLPIAADARGFLAALLGELARTPWHAGAGWLARIEAWRRQYPAPPPPGRAGSLAPQQAVLALGDVCRAGEVIVSDTGCTLAWLMQGFSFKKGQRLMHDWNNTAMGWALPAALGASLAADRSRVVCVTGDGSLMMGLSELATVVRYRLPVKIVVFNNNGYAMIRQTQDQWLESRYFASSAEGGLASTDFSAVAAAFGIPSCRISEPQQAKGALAALFALEGPALCELMIDEQARIAPQVRFGRPNEDSEPLLAREEFLAQMIVPPLEVSLTS
jgi:acetolactate synthase-1/2/3 large subunit